MNYPRLAFAAALLGLFLAGCSGAGKNAISTRKSTKTDGKVYAVSAESAAFFRYGPQPGREPDKTLPKETLVKLIRYSFGFSKVELVGSGEKGYVASEQLVPANSALIAAASAPKPDQLTRAHEPEPSYEQFNLNSDDPRLIPPPEDLPPTELPAPAPDQ